MRPLRVTLADELGLFFFFTVLVVKHKRSAQAAGSIESLHRAQYI